MKIPARATYTRHLRRKHTRDLDPRRALAPRPIIKRIRILVRRFQRQQRPVPRPRVPASLDKRTHARQCRRGNLRQLAYLLRIVRAPAFLGTAELRNGGGVPGPCFVTSSGSVEDEDGAEGGEGDHGYGDAGFDLLPEEEPGFVEGAADVEAGDADAGGDGHHDIEGEEDAEDDLLAGFDVDFPEEADWEGNNWGRISLISWFTDLEHSILIVSVITSRQMSNIARPSDLSM